MEKIAVILPVYNNDKAPYVHLSVNSILNQTYKGEICLYIGVDGPVGDDLANCLKEYEDKGINVLWFRENRGLAIVLNELIDIAHNDGYGYIARMDADDISMPNRFEIQIAYLCAHPDIDVVGGAIEEIDENSVPRNKTIVYPEGPEECYHFFSKRNPHAHPAVLFRWSFFEKINYGDNGSLASNCKYKPTSFKNGPGQWYRPEYRQNQDTMLWVDGMSKGTKHANVQEVVLRFRFTDSLFNKRRHGWSFAKKQLADRKMINKALRYSLDATLFGYAMFCLLVSPVWLKKIAYKIFR